ncbi:MAG: hypothetical protein E7107_02580 [Prevotella sp.]|nr:hypothetical protein [Prevotella sp.]
MKELPEFSQQNYKIAGYVVSTVVTCSGVYFLYQILFNSDISFSANWNMFDSILMWPLYIIGLLVMFMNWNLFSFSYDTYDKITYNDGHTIVKRNWDFIEWILGHVIAPIFGRFFLVPIIVAALIYYPLMCIVHLVGAIFPYILALIVVGIIFVSWKFTSWFQFRYHSWLLVLVGIVLTISFSWSGYVLGNPNNGGCNFPHPSSDTIKVEGGDDESNQFAKGPCIGLYSSLPNDTTKYKGDLEGFPIEFTIIKDGKTRSLKGTYKNVKNGTIMQLSGESLPSMDCDINFFGKDGNAKWTFYLTGDVDEITGTAKSGDTELELTLQRK